MKRDYKVPSGQNIYDVAITLYGSVEGIFDLLMSNKTLYLDSELKAGTILTYHDDFVINKQIVDWLSTQEIKPKNGEHKFTNLSIEDFIKTYITEEHPELCTNLTSMSPDEHTLFWEQYLTPRMLIKQLGGLCSFQLEINNNGYMFIDWGDYSDIEIIEGNELTEVEHYYDNVQPHIITMYGNFNCNTLDFSRLGGVYYPLSTITALNFIGNPTYVDSNKLIVQQ